MQVDARGTVTFADRSIRVSVGDKGSGFDPRNLEQADAGYGLFSINEQLLLHWG